jgi:multidrug efflux pump subunit AcrB
MRKAEEYRGPRRIGDGRVLRLSDVADVRDAWADDPARNYVDGIPSVVVNVSSTISEDILFIADATNKYMDRFQRTQYHGEGDLDQRCHHRAPSTHRHVA